MLEGTEYLESFIKEKNEGLLGRRIGIQFNLPRLNKVIPGIQKERLYLLGANSGVGKTKFVNTNFMFTAFDDWYEGGKKYPLRIQYFSMELPRSQIIAQLAVRWLWKKHRALLTVPYVLGYIKDSPLDMYYNELLESEEFREYVKAFQQVVNIIDKTLNSVGFNIHMNEIVREEGKVTYNTLENGMKMFKEYEEKDVNQVNLVFLDHISLVKPIEGQNERTMMIEMADIMIKLRNRFKFTFIVTQQLNRSSNSTDRHKLEDLLIKDSDFRGGSAIFDAADIVLGLFSPNRERQERFVGYQVASSDTVLGLENRLTVVNIVKNRHGSANGFVPLLFIGEVGDYEELPRDPNAFDYSILNTLKVHY